MRPLQIDTSLAAADLAAVCRYVLEDDGSFLVSFLKKLLAPSSDDDPEALFAAHVGVWSQVGRK